MQVIDIWINCPDAETAQSISARLITDRLVACSNTFAPVTSRYHWKGGIESETEVPLLVKTRDDLFDAVCAVVCDLHPYETPAIMAVPVVFVNDDYRQWVMEETARADT